METLVQNQHIRSRSQHRGQRYGTAQFRRGSLLQGISNTPSRSRSRFPVSRNLQDGYVGPRKIPAPRFRSSEKETQPHAFELNGFELIFVSNLIILLVVLSLFFSRSLGLMELMLDSESLYLPHGFYTGGPLSLVVEESPTAEVELIEVDHSQFEVLELSSYAIQPGDTLSQVSTDYNINMGTLISFNQIQDVRRIQIGLELQIPDRNGLLHSVQNGDTISALVDEYNSSFNAILDANSLTSEEILPGQTLFIPGARMDDTELKLALGELFIFPTNGYYTSGFGYRADPFTGERRFHNGIDWANQSGTSVRASMAGTVVHVESQIGNYGKFVIVQHAGGFQTLYAHMDSILARRGEYVSQGETIGRMGNTGRSTGSHLHFSIIRNGAFVDPLAYLH